MSLVLSALEFDVVWESERLPARHVALDVPSPGRTHTERAGLVKQAWAELESRGLAKGGRAVAEVADQVALLAHPEVSVDVWVWADRPVKAFAAQSGRQAALAVVDEGKVWLIPARSTALAESAVSVAGDMPAGGGRSVSVPNDVIVAADNEAKADTKRFITALEAKGVTLSDAQAVAAMLAGMTTRGQFGVERRHRDQRVVRADRVVAFHDTPDGRYLDLVRPSTDGRQWCTVTPADNQRLASCVWELLEEIS
ncbi:ESX secretion-associated protein EspG [Actinocrispum wychmicini]|uniref:ESAT-6 protein secretion system EspG family protein n=1 Tax=Actinocrispum wychmicini TaxID=1213861 RepID=A0A4R2K4Y3_9PSEU|nr:ESX secretion-associated protein EspG [Actinocrispum wychmicini]TCO64886.1 ESAT-6 protein secretion system EspG family protein [Actinocrispum wychmicini]